MRVGVLINDFDSLVPSQTTALFAHSLGGKAITTKIGETVEAFVFGVGDLGVDEQGDIVAHVRRPSATVPDVAQQVLALRQTTPETLALHTLDVILIRTNPARDPRAWAHDGALQLMAQLRHRGVAVYNDPDGLRLAGTKLFSAALPAHVSPRTLISANRDELEQFVRSSTTSSVVKPARGTRGNDVFKLAPDAQNVRAILDVLLRQGFVIAQAFVPEAVDGDTRVVVLDGEIMEHNGKAAAIRRVPHASDFRSNIAAGGSAHAAEISPAMRQVTRDIAPTLRRLGLRLVGLDFIGPVVCEVNVFSTGGFADASRFAGHDFATDALVALLQPPVARESSAEPIL